MMGYKSKSNITCPNILDLPIGTRSEKVVCEQVLADGETIKVNGVEAMTSLVSANGVPADAQEYRSTYDQSQSAYDPLTGVAYLPYMEDPDGRSPFENFMVLYDMRKREIIHSRLPIGSAHERDNHNAAWLHVDADGYLHMTYGAHNSTVYYRRSVAPHDADLSHGLTEERAVFDHASYPRIFSDPGRPGTLVVIYRGSDNPDGGSHKYMSAARSTDAGITWQHTLIADISGRGETPMIYPSAKMGHDGWLHVAWSWRPHHTGVSVRNGVGYAKSPDCGLTWYRADGSLYESLPLNETSWGYVTRDPAESVLCNWPLDAGQHPIIFHVQRMSHVSCSRWTGTEWRMTKVADFDREAGIDYMQANLACDGVLELIGQRRGSRTGEPKHTFRLSSADGGVTWDVANLREAPRLAADPDLASDYMYPVMVYDQRIEKNVYLVSTSERKILLIDPKRSY